MRSQTPGGRITHLSWTRSRYLGPTLAALMEKLGARNTWGPGSQNSDPPPEMKSWLRHCIIPTAKLAKFVFNKLLLYNVRTESHFLRS